MRTRPPSSLTSAKCCTRVCVHHEHHHLVLGKLQVSAMLHEMLPRCGGAQMAHLVHAGRGALYAVHAQQSARTSGVAYKIPALVGELPVRPSVRLRPIAQPHCLVRSFVQSPSRVRPSVRNLRLHLRLEHRPPSLRTPFPSVPPCPVTRTGTCYAIKLGTTADHFGHVLLASTYKNLA
ncbi:hypothetical protein K438DRAFT_1985430 [Mycena galopus ATCC 62051]|nr:hypothetical protein K438DRAFT_1985430 [Mycena galopus ATCC 62051]